MLSYLNDVAPLHPNGQMAYFNGAPPKIQGTGVPGVQLAFGVTKWTFAQNQSQASKILVDVYTWSNASAMNRIEGDFFTRVLAVGNDKVSVGGDIVNTIVFYESKPTKMGKWYVDLQMPGIIAGVTPTYKLIAHLDGYNYVSAWFDINTNTMRVSGKQRLANGSVVNINSTIAASGGTSPVFKTTYTFHKSMTTAETAVTTTKMETVHPTGEDLLEANNSHNINTNWDLNWQSEKYQVQMHFGGY
jgi:hypothetical protein